MRFGRFAVAIPALRRPASVRWSADTVIYRPCYGLIVFHVLLVVQVVDDVGNESCPDDWDRSFDGGRGW